MSGYECNGTNIFMNEIWNVLFAWLNRTFHLPPHENICTIALKTINHLFNI